jgi:hypothetical protein
LCVLTIIATLILVKIRAKDIAEAEKVPTIPGKAEPI